MEAGGDKSAPKRRTRQAPGSRATGPQTQVEDQGQRKHQQRPRAVGTCGGGAAAAAAAADSADSSVIEVLEVTEGDMELQRALLLSMQEIQSPRQEHQQQQQLPAGRAEQQQPHSPPARRGPMRGRKQVAAQVKQEEHTEEAERREADSQQQQQQQQVGAQQVNKDVAIVTTPLGRQPFQTPQARQQQQQQQQQPGSGAAKPAGGSAKKAAGGGSGGRGRKRKLPPYNPSADTVEECFSLLAAGGSSITVHSILQVASAMGLDLAMPAASNMMRYAAEHVLGWASGAGRTRGEIASAEFAALVDHFRVAD